MDQSSQFNKIFGNWTYGNTKLPDCASVRSIKIAFWETGRSFFWCFSLRKFFTVNFIEKKFRDFFEKFDKKVFAKKKKKGGNSTIFPGKSDMTFRWVLAYNKNVLFFKLLPVTTNCPFYPNFHSIIFILGISLELFFFSKKATKMTRMLKSIFLKTFWAHKFPRMSFLYFAWKTIADGYRKVAKFGMKRKIGC